MMEKFDITEEKKLVKFVRCKTCGNHEVFPVQYDSNSLLLVCKKCLNDKVYSVERVSVDEYKDLTEKLKME